MSDAGYFASVNGLQIVSGSLMIPLVGIWTADLRLAANVQIAGQCTIIIGNLTLQGFVFRSEPFGGQIRARIIGGRGGWRRSVPPQGYGNPSGVLLSTVLGDVAAAVGEQLTVAVDRSIGAAFARVNFADSVASDVLWQMLAQGFIPSWHVDVTGMTVTTPWATKTVTSQFVVTDQKPDEGIIEIATEDYASWMPGCVFANPLLTGTYTSAGVQYVWDNAGKFRFEVLTGDSEDRVLGPFQQIVQKEIAPLRFYGRYEYEITASSTSTIDGIPTDTDLGLPDVMSCVLRADSISSYLPPVGGKAEVQFTNGVPTRPVCVWTEGNSAEVQLAGGGPAVGRVGDAVTIVGPIAVTISGGAGSITKAQFDAGKPSIAAGSAIVSSA